MGNRYGNLLYVARSAYCSVDMEGLVQSKETNELDTALAAAQGMMKAATFNRINPHFKNRYADLAAVWDAIREPLSKNGLSITQTTERVLVGDTQGTDFFLQTTLRHKSGQWVCSYYPLPLTAKAQEMGSAITYARRYCLSAIVGVASDEDDDANEAQKIERPEVVHYASKPIVQSKPAKELSDDQKEQIKLYASELDSDRMQRFLVWLGINSIDDIRAHQYERAMAGLRKAVGGIIPSKQKDGVPDIPPKNLSE